MNKVIAAAVVAIAIFGGVQHAYAYTIVNGQPVFGNVSGVKPAPGPEQAFVAESAHAPVYVSDVVGNTRIYDFIKDIKSSDIAAFLAIVSRAGIHY